MWHDTTYYGKPTKLMMKAGVARAGPIEIGLIQPVSGDSIYNDFMSQQGGAALLAFQVDDVDEMTNIMGEKDFPVRNTAGSALTVPTLTMTRLSL